MDSCLMFNQSLIYAAVWCLQSEIPPPVMWRVIIPNMLRFSDEMVTITKAFGDLDLVAF